jgi:hypothetical protein
MFRTTALLCAALALATAVAVAIGANAAPAATASCLAAGDGTLQARVRGAIEADINWTNAQLTCEGGMRPDRKGIRVTLAGPMPGRNSRLRFVFGIALKDAAPGTAQVLPTNLTVILEGQQQLFATRGDDKCAVEQLEVTPLLANGGDRQRVHARGYCTGPASNLQGSQRVLVSTFEFTSQVNTGDEP